MTVWVVLIGGRVDSVWRGRELADRRILELEAGGAYAVAREYDVMGDGL